MKRWKHTLTNGLSLRNSINEANCSSIINSLYSCYREMVNKSIIDEDDFDYYTQDLEFYLGSDDIEEDDINCLLADFYDLCDSLEVWISI